MSDDQPFWRSKTMREMTQGEWESLCDGCGQCCLHKLEDADTGEIALTNVACRYLDLNTCQCGDYPNRQTNVPDCVRITPGKATTLRWLPDTCAYRLVARGAPLPDWHPLLTGDPNSVHDAGVSVRVAPDKVISEDDVDDLEDHVVEWLNDGADPFGRCS